MCACGAWWNSKSFTQPGVVHGTVETLYLTRWETLYPTRCAWTPTPQVCMWCMHGGSPLPDKVWSRSFTQPGVVHGGGPLHDQVWSWWRPFTKLDVVHAWQRSFTRPTRWETLTRSQPGVHGGDPLPDQVWWWRTFTQCTCMVEYPNRCGVSNQVWHSANGQIRPGVMHGRGPATLVQVRFVETLYLTNPFT